jgi:hypothetical protein
VTLLVGKPVKLSFVSSFYCESSSEYDIVFVDENKHKNVISISIDSDSGRLITFAKNLVEKCFEFGKLKSANFNSWDDSFVLVFEKKEIIETSDKEVIWAMKIIAQVAEKEYQKVRV